MLQPLTVQHHGRQIVLACVHWKVWPPSEALLGQDIEEQRRQGWINNEQYAKYLVWQRVCGITKMEETKCLACPLARSAEVRDHLPCLVTLDGLHAVPLMAREGERLARGSLVASYRPPGSPGTNTVAEWNPDLTPPEKDPR